MENPAIDYTECYTDKVYEWIIMKMKFDKWYEIKTPKQKLAIIELFDEGLIYQCELNADETNFRKVELDFTIKKRVYKNKMWYDQTRNY